MLRSKPVSGTLFTSSALRRALEFDMELQCSSKSLQIFVSASTVVPSSNMTYQVSAGKHVGEPNEPLSLQQSRHCSYRDPMATIILHLYNSDQHPD